MDSNVSDGSGSEVLELESPGCYVALTYKPLSAQSILDRVASPKAGANVLFSGSRVSQGGVTRETK